MRRSLSPLLVLAMVACSTTSEPTPKDSARPPESPPGGKVHAVEDALAEPTTPASSRPSEDLARDPDRKPQEVLAFFGVGPGSRVVELMAGRGYYAHVLAEAVGPEGEVWAHNTPFVLDRFAERPLTERLALPGLEKVRRLDTELEDPQLPADLDAVLIVLFYHDTYWQEIDRARMNAAVFEALKPGGVFGVVDHHAEAGSGDRDVKRLHRVDAELVKRELLEAGFVFDGASDLLRREDDDRTVNVFEASMRGKTDRFVYRFRKPG